MNFLTLHYKSNDENIKKMKQNFKKRKHIYDLKTELYVISKYKTVHSKLTIQYMHI